MLDGPGGTFVLLSSVTSFLYSIINNSGCKLRTRACQFIVGYMSIFVLMQVNDHPATLGVTRGQLIDSPSYFWLYIPK